MLDADNLYVKGKCSLCWLYLLISRSCRIICICCLQCRGPSVESVLVQVWCPNLLYYKSWNNWNPFSPRWGPPYPSRRPHLSGQKVWWKRGRLVSSIFSTKILILFTPGIFYTHLLYPHITFLWRILYFPLNMHSPIIRIIICLEG